MLVVAWRIALKCQCCVFWMGVLDVRGKGNACSLELVGSVEAGVCRIG